jgi:hypothetical protein
MIFTLDVLLLLPCYIYGIYREAKKKRCLKTLKWALIGPFKLMYFIMKDCHNMMMHVCEKTNDDILYGAKLFEGSPEPVLISPNAEKANENHSITDIGLP